MTTIIRQGRIEELHPLVSGAGRLGRHIHHDSRSLSYQYPTEGLTLTTTVHERRIPVLDQGSLGSCTGNAAVGCLGTDPFYGMLPAGTELDEELAVLVYSNATKIDDSPGEYPPDDTGSSGLAVADVLRKLGWVSGYQHVFSRTDLLLSLTRTPGMLGIGWYDSFDKPDSSGRIRISPNAQVRGGHELEVSMVDVENQVIGLTNSWGSSWGVNGRCFLGWADLGRLLDEQGDYTILIPLSQPAPVPTPTPLTADANDNTLWKAIGPWATTRHCCANAKAAKSTLAWAAAKGLR